MTIDDVKKDPGIISRFLAKVKFDGPVDELPIDNRTPFERLTDKFSGLGIAMKTDVQHFTDVTLIVTDGDTTRQFNIRVYGHITEKECAEIEGQARKMFPAFFEKAEAANV